MKIYQMRYVVYISSPFGDKSSGGGYANTSFLFPRRNRIRRRTRVRVSHLFPLSAPMTDGPENKPEGLFLEILLGHCVLVCFLLNIVGPYNM